MDEADQGLEKPKNHAQTIVHEFQPPIPCLGLLPDSQARQARFSNKQRIIDHPRPTGEGVHLFLSSDEAGYITGAVIHVDGGASVGR